jgi:hypothetical protein
VSPVFDPDLPKETKMQFKPKTDQELADEAMLPEGIYDFTIEKANDTVSKTTGNPMIVVDLTIFSERGERRIKDYLMEKMAWKLKHFAFAIGMGAAYEKGDLDAQAFIGRSGKVKLRKGQANGDFQARNEVKDYIVPDSETMQAPAAANAVRPAAPAAGTDEPPF